jgi:hypothetical protein
MKTSAAQTKRRIRSVLADFPAAKMPLALDFLEYLKRKDEEMDATEEILNDKVLVGKIRAARANIKKHGLKHVTPWRGIRTDV